VTPSIKQYLPEYADQMLKLAMGKHADFGDEHGTETPAPSKPKSRLKEVAKVMGKSVGGLTLGTLAGAGLGRGLEHGARALGHPIPKSLIYQYGMPAAGGALGTAYGLWKAREAQELNNALESTRDSGK
jgi:hypothetical protein